MNEELGQALNQADRNARKRDFEKDGKQRDQAEELKKISFTTVKRFNWRRPLCWN